MKYTLAPLAEFTNAPFRRLCARLGADGTTTEMVSAAALMHGHVATRQLMETLPGEPPPAVQIFCAAEEEAAFAAREISRGVAAGDFAKFPYMELNAGCPMPRIRAVGAGAALADDPERVARLLAAMKREAAMPIALKTRLGPRPDCVRLFELLSAAETSGAVRITLHARFTSQMHSGEVHLDLLAEACARSRIPVCGNGGVKNAADASAMAQTGVCEIMIGRAALPEPAIFSSLKGEPADADAGRLFSAHLDAIVEFHALLCGKYADVPPLEPFAMRFVRTHLMRYFHSIPGAAGIRRKLALATSLAEARDIASAKQ